MIEPGGGTGDSLEAARERTFTTDDPALGADRSGRFEALKHLPSEITGKRIFGRSVGDLVKEAAISAAVGALFRIGFSTIIPGGIALNLVGGAGAAGVMEARRQFAENQKNSADRIALKEQLKKLEWGPMVGAIGRGAIFAGAGGLVSNFLGSVSAGATDVSGAAQAASESAPSGEAGRLFPIDAVGGFFHNVGLKVGEATGLGGNMPWDVQAGGPQAPSGEPVLPEAPQSKPPVPAPPDAAGPPQPPADVRVPAEVPPTPATTTPDVIAKGTYSPEIKLPANAADWMRGANDIHGDYGLMKQAAVGKILPRIDEFLSAQGITEANTDPLTFQTLRDQLIGGAEAKINSVYDSHLQEAVANGMSLEQMESTWGNDFTQWVQGDMNTEMVESLHSMKEGMAQIQNIAANPTYTIPVPVEVPAGGIPPDSPFNWVSQNDAWWKENAQTAGALLAINYETLYADWAKAFPRVPFPAHFGEIDYLVKTIKGGGLDAPEALERLRAVVKRISGGEKLKDLTPEGIGEVWKLLHSLK